VKSLNQYVFEQIMLLERFRVFWQLSHNQNPQAYPIEFGEEDAGLWDERFELWVADGARSDHGRTSDD
jgi:hypothetical protein